MTSTIPFLTSYLPPALLSALAVVSFLLSLHSNKPRMWRGITTVLSVLVFVSLCAIFYHFTIDDTYISLRYARNLSQGHGLTYSVDGQTPVEGYTNFLWVVLETPLFLLGLDDNTILHVVKLIGIAFGIGILLFTRKLASQIGTSPVSSQAAILLTSSIPFFAFWAIGGLETSMYIFFALAAVSSLFLNIKRRNSTSGRTCLYSEWLSRDRRDSSSHLLLRLQ